MNERDQNWSDQQTERLAMSQHEAISKLINQVDLLIGDMKKLHAMVEEMMAISHSRGKK